MTVLLPRSVPPLHSLSLSLVPSLSLSCSLRVARICSIAQSTLSLSLLTSSRLLHLLMDTRRGAREDASMRLSLSLYVYLSLSTTQHVVQAFFIASLSLIRRKACASRFCSRFFLPFFLFFLLSLSRSFRPSFSCRSKRTCVQGCCCC